MKKIKKALAVVMCVVLTLTAAPLGGFVGLDLPSLFDFKAEASSYSGTCGGGLTWTLDTETGELNITGTGAMSDWSTPSDVPWHTSRIFIKSVNIKSGVTSIGNYAFDYCENLESITFPGSVTSIGTSAFGCEDGFCEFSDVYYTGDLAGWCAIDFKDNWSNPNRCADVFYIDGSLLAGDIVIPDEITTIKDYTFLNCKNITSVTIPDGVESIGKNAFYLCEGLANVTIPESVTSIGDYAFCVCSSLTSVTIPGNVTSIGNRVFSSCYKLSTVIIQDGITSIGTWAFSFCEKLKNITIPDSITNVGNDAFNGCSAIQAVYYPGTPEQWGNVTVEDTTDNGYFLRNIVYECNSDRPYYTGSCGSKLQWKLFTDGELIISGTGSMSNWTGYGSPVWTAHRSIVKSIIISEGVTSIGSYAFDCLSNLTSVTIPDSVTAIGSSAFYSCKSLTNITIPDGVKTIDTYTFCNCQSLTSITIPDSVTTIRDYAFSYCDNLTDVYYGSTQENWDKISISSYNEPLTSATIYFTEPEEPTIASGTCGDNLTWTLYEGGLLSISGTGAMDDYTNSSSPWYSYKDSIKTVNIANGITAVGDYALYDCNSLTNVAILNSVTTIGDYAFGDCDSLANVRIGKGVKTIGGKAFCNCPALTTVTIPDSVIAIGNGAFSNCPGLTTVTIPDSVTAIEDKAFCGCTSLASVTLGNGVKTIGNYVFSDCRSLTSIIIPDNVTTIGNYAFSGCSGLKNITIGNGITTISTGTFRQTDLTSIRIPDSVTAIGDSAFSSCDKLTEVHYSSTEEDWNKISIGSDNEPLTSATIRFNKPKELTVALGMCGDNLTWTLYESGLLEINGTGDMENYSYDSFPWYSYRTSIITVDIADGVTSIGDYAFCYCENITTVTIPDSLKTIGDYVFVDCYNLSSVTIPAGMEAVGEYSFGWYATPYFKGTLEQWNAVETSSGDTSISKRVVICGGTDRPYYIPGTCGTKLNWILYADGELVISGSGAMTNWSSSSNVPWYSMREKINSVTVEEGVTSIGKYAFYNCQEITKATIPESVTDIGNYAFMYCYGIKELTMPVSAKIANSYTAFSGCYSIEKLTLTAGTGVMQNYSTSSSSSSYTYYQYTPWYESRARLNEIIIEDGVTSIGNNAFYEAYGAESVRIPAGVTSIGNSAFKSTYGDLTDVYYNSTEEEWNRISIGSDNELLTSATLHTATASDTCGDNLNWVLYDTGRLEITGTGAMTSWTSASEIPWYDYRTEINEIIIGEGVTSIGEYAFFSCTANKSVNIPESVTSIEAGAFGNSRNITGVHYASDKSDWDKITKGGTNNALNYAEYSYGRVVIVDSGWFGEFHEWELHTDGELYMVGEGGMSNLASAEHYPWNKHKDKVTSVTIDYNPNLIDDIRVIGDYAFEGFVNLKSVDFRTDLTRIGKSAFEGCSSLESITLPDSLKEIDENAFADCSSVKSVNYTGTYEQWNKITVKSGNSALFNIMIFDSDSERPYYTPGVCGESLEWVLYTDGELVVTGTGAMTDWSSSKAPWYSYKSDIKTVNIASGVTTIGDYAFIFCSNLTGIIMPDSIITIGEGAFLGCDSLTDIAIPDSVTSIANYAFESCSNLTRITIGNSVTTIGDCVFNSCYNLARVIIPGSVSVIGFAAFNECYALTDVCYNSTEEDWSKIYIGSYNEPLYDATIHFNYDRHTHNFEWFVEAAPTATQDGFKKKICTDCGSEGESAVIPATGFEPISGMVVDYADNIVYGFDAGVNSLDSYTAFVTDGCEWIYEQGQYGFGTGTVATLKDGNTTVAEYTVLIFGDIDGNGWYDANDAFIVNMLASGLISADRLSEAQQRAADCNHDGVIDGADFYLLNQASLLLEDIDQTAAKTELETNSVYIEYMSLIDQSAGVETEETMPETNEAAGETDIEMFFAAVFEFIRKIFEFVLSFVIG